MKLKTFLIQTIILFTLFNIFKGENIHESTLRILQNNTSTNSNSKTNEIVIDTNKNITYSNTTNNSTVNSTVTPKVYEDKFNIEIYKSSMNRSELEKYKIYISSKDIFFQKNQFTSYIKKFSPENPQYMKENMVFAKIFYILAGIFGFLFFVYLSLRLKWEFFKGSKKENLETEFKFIAWGLFSMNNKYLIIF